MTAAPLAGRIAIVTGGGRGIGAAVARVLAGAGAAVAVAARSPNELERLAAELVGGGARAIAVPCDVTREADVEALFATTRARLGAVDILVNNAGGASSAPVTKLTREAWDAALAVNATGAFLCTKAALPSMLASGWGRIVAVASLAGLDGARYVAHYSAAKHALLGFVRSLALELEGTGVAASAVCPGYVDTPMTAETVANVTARTHLAPDAALAAVLSTTGQERLLDADEVARAIATLCVDGANGAIVTLDTRRSRT